MNSMLTGGSDILEQSSKKIHDFQHMEEARSSCIMLKLDGLVFFGGKSNGKAYFPFGLFLGLKIFEELINSWQYFLTKTSKMHLTNHHYRKVVVQTQMQLDWLSTLSLENVKQL
jgi:hypothetical protein